jgi:predicted dehydrogenase
VVGYGTIAINWTPNFLNDPRCQMVAVCDLVEESPHYGYKGELTGGREVGRRKIDEFYGKAEKKPVKTCQTYTDFREMFAKEDLSAVQICTPDHWHAYQVITAARQGRHIYAQKPLSVTIDEGKKMIAAVKDAGVVFQTGSQQRSDNFFRKACEIARNGWIGKVKRVRVGLPGGHLDWNGQSAKQAPEKPPAGFDFDTWVGPAPAMEYRPALHPLNWRHNFNFSGGMVTDFGAHHIDIAHWGLGKDGTGPVSIEDVSGELPPPDALYNTAGKFKFTAKYADGCEIMVADSTAKLMPEIEELMTKDGKEFNHQGILFEGENGQWVYVNRGIIMANPKDILRRKPEAGETALLVSKNHTGNFFDAIYTGSPLITPIEVGHRSISVAHLANIALRLGKSKIPWDPDTESSSDPAVQGMLARESRKPWTL